MAGRRVSYAAVYILLLFSFIAGIFTILSETRVSTPLIARAPASRIGVVRIYGEIYFPFSDTALGARSGPERIVNTLKRYREDDRIKAVILRINSPGGSIGAVQEIVKEINRVKEEGKPVVASVADLGASGGYYIASAADRIVANEGSIIGSIGVIMASGDFSQLLDNLGIKIETIKSGAHKDAGSFHRPLTGAEKAYLQDMVDDAFNQFIVSVSTGRRMPEEEVKKFARGQIYTGRQAKELNLIDLLGDFDTARETAEKLAGIEDSSLVREKRHYDLTSLIRLFGSRQGALSLPISEKYSGISYLYAPR